MPRWAKRRDANEPEIVAALRKGGCKVERLDDYDLHVKRAGKEYRLEVKMPDGKLTKRQQERADNGVIVVRSVTDALRAVGLA